MEHRAPGLLVMGGSSFGYGYGLSDEHTLSAVLQRELQTPVFNGSRFFTDPDGLVELDDLLRQMPVKPESVVFLHLEQQNLFLRGNDNPYPEAEQPPRQSLQKLGHETIGPLAYRSLEERYVTFKRSFGTWLRLSPLRIMATRWQKALANDRILPNSGKAGVTALQLTNGRRILFEYYEWRRATSKRPREKITGTVEYLAWMKDRLNERGLRMYVVTVPDKASVYRDSLVGRADVMQQLHQSNGAEYLTDLHSALSARGVNAIDGLAVLRRTAAADIADGRLTYYLDDAHWNALGVERIGRAAARTIASHERFAAVQHSAQVPR
jgi:hypothetical protein